MGNLRQGLSRVIRGLAQIGILLWLLRPVFALFTRKRAVTHESQTDNHERASEAETEAEADPTRRRFLALAAVSAGGFMATVMAVPVIGFVLAPMFRTEPPVWRSVGAVDDFEIGATVHVEFEDPSALPWAGVASASAAWLRRVAEEQFEAYSIYCTHLGCTVRWLEEANLFMCPCHGAVFKRDGEVSTGPARRPLVRHDVRVREEEVEILTRPLPITGPITTPEE